MKTKGKSGVMDMTQGNMAMLILSFALPLMLGNVFQQFYTVADTAIVGKILGVDALAALGTVESINWLVLGTIQGITQGFGILVSQQFGAKKEEALQETIFHASFLAVVAAILFTVGILIGLPGLVGILQVPVDIRPICLDYLYVLFGGIPLMMLYNFTAAMLRAFGDSKTPGAWLGRKGCSACNCDRPDPCFCILSLEAVPYRGAYRKKEGRQMETSCRTLREADLSWITDGISKPCDRHWRHDRADCGKQLRRCIYRRLYGDVQALWYP